MKESVYSATINFGDKSGCTIVGGNTIGEVIKFHHVDRESALSESKWSGLVNSTLFLPKINREIRNQFGSDYPIIDLRSVPDNVTIDTSGFLAEVTITI